MTSFGNLMILFIAMTHAGCCIKLQCLLLIAITYTVEHVWARTHPLNMFGHLPTPHLLIKPCLDMTSFGNLLLLFIAMTHAECGLKLCSVINNSDDIYPRACLGKDTLLEHVRARSPPQHVRTRTRLIYQSNSVLT